jgi:hypothetical protein
VSEALIISPRPPKKPFNRDKLIAWLALIVSLSAAIFSGLQYRAANREAAAAEEQVALARQTRDEARQAIRDQAIDVERARKAAEKSADAAQQLAGGMARSARAAETSAQAGRAALELSRRSLILANAPSLQVLTSALDKPLGTSDPISVLTRIVNAGKGIAYQTQINQWLRIAPTFTFPYTAVSDLTSIEDIPPSIGGTAFGVVSKMQDPMTKEIIELIESGKLMLYIYGRAVFHDLTLEKPKTYTWHFCQYYYSVDRHSLGELTLSICPEGNYTTVQ